MMQEKFDRSRAAALARQVGTDFGAALTVALAFIGDRFGLFKLLAAGEPLTTVQISQRAGLNERYVREWASTMAAAGYLEYQPANAAFLMTPEQAMVLAREDNTFFTAGAFQYAVACYRQIDKLRGVVRFPDSIGRGLPCRRAP